MIDTIIIQLRHNSLKLNFNSWCPSKKSKECVHEHDNKNRTVYYWILIGRVIVNFCHLKTYCQVLIAKIKGVFSTTGHTFAIIVNRVNTVASAITIYLQGCLTSKQCSASSLNCRYLNPYIKLKVAELAISNYLNNFEIKWIVKFLMTSKWCCKSKQILSFTNLICSSISGPKALKRENL